MSSGFITESEIEERKRIRQEEWEKVRLPEEPIEAPEEPFDHRSLFDRLQEQKNRKQEEFEESRKLKNLVKTLDDEEVEFLDYVDQVRVEEERKKRLEEARELSEFRHAVSEFREKELERAIHQEIAGSLKPKRQTETQSVGLLGKTPQSRLLAGVVKRKSPSKPSETSQDQSTELKKQKIEREEEDDSCKNDSSTTIESVPDKGSLVCIGVLPGLASYSDSSDDEDEDVSTKLGGSTYLRSGMIDLCGRKVEFEDTKKSD